MAIDGTSRIQRLVFLGLIFLLIAGIALLLSRSWDRGEAIEITIPTPSAVTVAEAKVYVSGAVRDPGVYSLKQGDRVEQAIIAAGGFAQEAAQDQINLAARVRDEQHIHVPKPGEPAAQSATSPETTTKININTASLEQLDTLKGIGEVRAKAIVDFRTKNGPFKRIEDLRDRKVIPASVFETIKNQITTE